GKKSIMGAQTEKPSGTTSVVMMKMDLNEAFENAFTGLISNYIALKDAFVQSNVSEVQARAGNTLKELDKIDVSSLKNMENLHMEAMKTMLNAIQKSKDIEGQRAHFKILS